MNDPRNLTDEFKGLEEADIIDALDARGVSLHIAIENVDRDFNMGSIVRTANAFGVRHVHVIGRRQWNKRGAMATDRYLHVHYHGSVDDFADAMAMAGRVIIAIDNVEGATDIAEARMDSLSVLVFGSEGEGISQQLRDAAQYTVMIPQNGSTRSLNVAAAAAIAMYAWIRSQNV